MWLSRAPEEPVPFAVLSITNPKTVPVGESYEVEVQDAKEGELVRLTVDAGYGPRSFSNLAGSDVTTFNVPASTFAESGVVSLQASTLHSNGWSQLEVVPGEAVDPIDLYLGPRTVVADNEQYSMIVAVPTDRFGNPVTEGTPVEFVHHTPSDGVEQLDAATANLLAFVELSVGTKSGRSRIATSVGSASGQERTFNEVAGVTVAFTVEPIDTVPFADGSSLLRLETSELFDRFGNQLPDGTHVTLTVDDNGVARRLSNVTIDGVASFTLEAPSSPTTFDVQAESGGTTGEGLELVFSSAVSSFETQVAAVVSNDGEDATELKVGPVVTVDGAYIPDGSEVAVDYDGHRFEAETVEGVATIFIEAVDGDAKITVLGYSVTVDLGKRR